MLRTLFATLTLCLVTASLAGAQTISFDNPPAAVGAGLRSSTTPDAVLSDPQHGGVLVTIASSDTLLALVAPDANSVGSPEIQVFVPNGFTDAGFVVHGLEGVTGQVQITANAPGFTGSSTDVDIVTPAVDIAGLLLSTDVPDPDDAFNVRVGLPNGAGTSVGTVQQVRFGGFALTATVTSTDAGIGDLVTTSATGSLVTVDILPGAFQTASSVAAGGVALDGVAPGTVTIDATIPGLVPMANATRMVTVDPAEITTLGLPSNVGSGLRSSTLTARLNGSAHGGVTVHIESVDPTTLLLSQDDEDVGQASVDIFVADGSTDADFWAHGLEGQTGIVSVSMSAPGFPTVFDAVEVETPAFEISGLGAALDTLDPVDPFRVRVGLANGGGGSVSPTQVIRPGGVPVVATVFTDDPAVGLLETSSTTADTVQVTIPTLASSTPTSVAAGGVAFDGVGAGTTQVTAQVPGFVSTLASFKSVNVTQPGISLFGVGNDLGAGLQTGVLTARLGASQHGGVTVRVEIDDPTLALISDQDDVVGSSFVDVPLTNGQIDADFYLQGLEGQSGFLVVTASAPGFSTVVDSLEVVQPAIDITGLGLSPDTADPVDVFRVRIGVPNASFTSLIVQELRPGVPPLSVDVSVTDVAIGHLETLAGNFAATTVDIPALSTQTPSSIAAGGIGFKALSPGSVDVAASAPGYFSLPNATRTVNVAAASMSFIGTTTDLGSGLQSLSLRARLSGSAHGGTLVHIESLDPGILILSDNGAVEGQTAVDVLVSDGSIDAFFYAQALDGQTGTVTLEATAPGFVTEVSSIDVVIPAVNITSLSSALDVSDPDDNFRVKVGLPNGSLTTVSSPQVRRPGGSPLVATVSTSMPAVSEIVTLGGSSFSEVILIPAGANQTPSTVALGGVGHRAIGAGNTLVSVSIPGFLQVGDSIKSVTVSNSGIALLNVPAQLGDGLQAGPLTARLSDPSHGGVTVNIASDDPAVALISDDPLTAGSASVNVALNNGETDAFYYLQGVAGTTGSATVTATATGFNDGNVAVSVVDAALQMAQLPDSLDVFAANSPFLVQVGVPDPAGDALAQLQAVSGAAGTQTIDVQSSTPTAQLVTTPLTASAVTVDIAVGDFQSGASVATGGIALDPLLPGSTTITASAPGLTSTTAASQVVLVTGTLTAIGDPLPVALGLEQNHPNPFNPQTTIRFALPNRGRAELSVYDLAGRVVTKLVDGVLEAGSYDLTWAGNDSRGREVASGIYLYRLKTEDGSRVRKMVLLR